MSNIDTAKDAYIASATAAADAYINTVQYAAIKAAYVAGYTAACRISATEASKIYIDTSKDFINYVSYYIQSLNDNINALNDIVDGKSTIISSTIYNAIQSNFDKSYSEYFK